MGTSQTPILELIFCHSERQSVSEDPPAFFHSESRKITDFREAAGAARRHLAAKQIR
jgi:hypothetical protein